MNLVPTILESASQVDGMVEMSAPDIENLIASIAT